MPREKSHDLKLLLIDVGKTSSESGVFINHWFDLSILYCVSFSILKSIFFFSKRICGVSLQACFSICSTQGVFRGQWLFWNCFDWIQRNWQSIKSWKCYHCKVSVSYIYQGTVVTSLSIFYPGLITLILSTVSAPL